MARRASRERLVLGGFRCGWRLELGAKVRWLLGGLPRRLHPLASRPRPAGAGGGRVTIVIPTWLISTAMVAGVTLVVALAIVGVLALYVVFTFRK